MTTIEFVCAGKEALSFPCATLKDAVVAALAQGADLQFANLAGADLSGLSLSRANLAHANMRGACLDSTNLQYANLSGADLEQANLHGTDLRWATIPYARLQGAVLELTDFRGANLHGADLRGAYLDSPRLSHADIGAAQFHRAEYITRPMMNESRMLWEELPIIQLGLCPQGGGDDLRDLVVFFFEDGSDPVIEDFFFAYTPDTLEEEIHEELAGTIYESMYLAELDFIRGINKSRSKND